MPLPPPPPPPTLRAGKLLASLSGIGLLVLLASCSTTPSGSLGDADDARIGVAAVHGTDPATSGPERLARAMAIALEDPAARAIVARALRASDLTEHKLPLRDFLASDASTSLRLRVAQRLEMLGSPFDGYLDTLPAIDFYMVARAHRLSWLPSAPVLVAAHMANTPPAYAFDSEGRRIPLALGDGILPPTALLLLQAAEPKERLTRIRDPMSTTIESVNEVSLRGRSVAYSICNPDINPGCEENGGGGGGDDDPPPCTDYWLRGVATFNLIDNGNPFEGNEIEVHASNGTYGDYARVTGLMPTDSKTVNLQIFCSPSAVTFTAKETDPGYQPDDNFTLPLPHTVKQFTVSNGVATFLWTWPDQLDPLYFYPKVSVLIQW